MSHNTGRNNLSRNEMVALKRIYPDRDDLVNHTTQPAKSRRSKVRIENDSLRAERSAG
jgi:hypothetical protein